MSLEKIGLGKLLELMYATPSRAQAMLRGDIRDDAKLAAGVPRGKGGDFYVPFWADAKAHARNASDLRKTSAARIAQHKGREKRYSLLASGFLRWWEEDRRYRNEPVTVAASPSIPPVEAAGISVKVENTLKIVLEGHGPRLLYPYFRLEPALSDEAARVALWLLTQAATGEEPDTLRILDVCRGRSYALEDTPLQGDEEQVFAARLAKLQERRAALLAEADDLAA